MSGLPLLPPTLLVLIRFRWDEVDGDDDEMQLELGLRFIRLSTPRRNMFFALRNENRSELPRTNSTLVPLFPVVELIGRAVESPSQLETTIDGDISRLDSRDTRLPLAFCLLLTPRLCFRFGSVVDGWCRPTVGGDGL
jgi:hypothetical protein